MIQLITYSLCLLFGLAAVPALATPAVRCQLSIAQTEPGAEPVTLLTDTVDCVDGIPMTGYHVGFSSDIEVSAIDSNKCDLVVHIVTLGPRSSTISRRFTVEYELPARLTGIPAKGGGELAFTVVPLEPIEIDLGECPYNHRAGDQFKSRPSANADFYYVQGSFGDYYWPTVKSMFEYEYRQVANMLKFSLPGKYTVYLAPCFMASVWWDRNFAMMVDPTRSLAVGVYGHTAVGADPFIMISAAVQRNLGYSHPMLIDGIAGYFAPATLDMREILLDDPSPMLSRFADPVEYRGDDPRLADLVASSFVKYLMASFGPGQFKNVYREAHDLNLTQALESTYRMSLADMENDWRQFVDTVTIDLGTLSRYAQRAEGLFAYDAALKQYRRMIERAANANDSGRVLSDLHLAYFYSGDYYNAAEAAEQLAALDTANVFATMAQGSYLLMAGRSAPAIELFEKAAQIDSNSALIAFNRGLYYHTEGRDQRAREALQQVVTESAGGGAQAESRVLLGTILLGSDDAALRQQATGHFKAAQGIINSVLGAEPSRADLYMWNGISYAGTGDIEVAREYLQIGYFLETRPYYLGMINLWLGKVADLENDHETAREYYANVISLPAAAYHQDEAKRLIENPFTWQAKL